MTPIEKLRWWQSERPDLFVSIVDNVTGLDSDQERTFVFALPYPFRSKEEPGRDFVRKKIEWARYPTLPTAVQLLEDLQTELYRDAVVPIALAHRYTAISLQPSGPVLDLLTRRALK